MIREKITKSSKLLFNATYENNFFSVSSITKEKMVKKLSDESENRQPSGNPK